MTSKDRDLIAEAYGTVYRGEKTEQASKDYSSVADEELGPDPKDLAQYDEYEKARKEINYDNYAAWDAYHAVKEGAWSEDDFLQWMRSVWADGANSK
jgi:hypothetical protein